MDLSQMSDSTKVDLCRKYFIIGLFCLPLVWLTNVVWFFGEAFIRPSSAITPTIRTYVILSTIGVLFWLLVLCGWEIIFQSYRSRGVAWADYLTFIFPVGRV
ncbi:unnamed protein product [Angiostrongylus costaricensis]|uniref:Gamma-secretase subunit PEN-2 n=1 Tax=Angiostrongylus costaricensis TaxID=334426 RepID=A0A0R3PK58_ANGCS|nr:unnamed protein product [Angiostrongylus costaricensis]